MRLAGFPKVFQTKSDEIEARKNHSLIVEAKEVAERRLEPASPKHVLVKIELLFGRGYQVEKNDTVDEELWVEWLEDLEGYPADLINLACKNWRNSNVKKPPYAAGELMESVKAEFNQRRSDLYRAKQVLSLIEIPALPSLYRSIDEKPPNEIVDLVKGLMMPKPKKCRSKQDQLDQLAKDMGNG